MVTVVECKGHMLELYIYNDYTNLNIKLIDEYNLDLKIFYNKLPQLNITLSTLKLLTKFIASPI